MIIGKHIHSHWMGECGNGHTLSSSLHARNIQERLCKSHIVPLPFVINFFFLKFSHPSLQGVLHIREGGGSYEEDCQGVQKKIFSKKHTHKTQRTQASCAKQKQLNHFTAPQLTQLSEFWSHLLTELGLDFLSERPDGILGGRQKLKVFVILSFLSCGM